MNSTAYLPPTRPIGLGSTDVAALVGCPWRSLQRVWREKRAELHGEPPEAVYETPQMRAGRQAEARLLVEAGRRLGRPVRPGSLSIHPQRRWAFANPDGLLTDRQGALAVIEAKAVFSLDRVQDWNLGPPQYVVAQTLWQAVVTGATKAYVIAQYPSGTVELMELDAAPERQQRLLHAASQLWESILSGRPPAARIQRKDRLSV